MFDNMKITAVICEYNPFHKGHKLQLDAIKSQGDSVVCIMSGGFVQRGNPAIFDKYKRAEAAVRAGADLVLELPFPYSCSAAEHFAYGGVGTANALGVVDKLSFGSECGDLDRLRNVSERVTSEEFSSEFTSSREKKENKNLPYAVLRQQVYKKLYGEEIPLCPNDILGVEYITALKKLNSGILPVTYKREEGFSATCSRELIEKENCFDMIPEEVAFLFENADRYALEYGERAILAYYRGASPDDLKEYEGMTDGIADRLVKNASDSVDLGELMEKTSGKSYTNAKIRRCIIHGMTGVTPKMLKETPLFTNVLACNGEGRRLIRRISKEGSIKLLTKPVHYKRLEGTAFEQARFALSADRLLTLMCSRTKKANEFLTRSPFVAE